MTKSEKEEKVHHAKVPLISKEDAQFRALRTETEKEKTTFQSRMSGTPKSKLAGARTVSLGKISDSHYPVTLDLEKQLFRECQLPECCICQASSIDNNCTSIEPIVRSSRSQTKKQE